MIADYLDRNYVIAQTSNHRDWLIAFRDRVKAKDKAALAEMKKHKLTLDKLDRAIKALDASLKVADKDKDHPQGTAFIPRDPLTCLIQTEMTKVAETSGNTEQNLPAEPSTTSRRRSVTAPARAATTTSAVRRLRQRPGEVIVTDARGKRRSAFKEGWPLINGGDVHYGLDGFFAKFGALFTGPREFNKRPAQVASTKQSLRLFVFGDWGTGLPLAQEVTKRIGEQLAASDGKRQQHVIHLGDVYYVGDAKEYTDRALPFWPVSAKDKKRTGSWSLNGNHDMYAGGYGYFDTLLSEDRFLVWHGDENRDPSSFFLIEDPDWQVFGLDTSWLLPSLKSVAFDKPTKDDYMGQNGVLTPEQVKWMAKMRNPSKGCILLTHHQPASSRSSEKQHADQAIAALRDAEVYDTIDAWIWGHEHRAAVFKPKKERKHRVLKDAPEFCACIGHGGVPVTAANFEADKRIPDVLWDENRLGPEAPLYEGERVVPFGFARIETAPGQFDFRVFDHDGAERFKCTVSREPAKEAAPARGLSRRSVAAKPSPKKRR